MSTDKEIKQLQKAKSKAQISNNLKEEAGLCNQLGELLAKNGNYQAAIDEHRQELALSEVLHDVIGCAIANRKIGECYAELGNIEAALKHQRQHLDLARSVNDAAEEQRALATIGRTYLFLHDSDQSRDSLKQAEDAFKKSLAILDRRLEGTVSARELSEMRARLLLNLGFVFDGLKEPQRCSEFIRQSIYISEKNNLLEDLYRGNFNLGSIHFRNGQHSLAMRCFEKSKECARKMSDKFSESECFYAIGKVLLNLGDLLAARRSLKQAFRLGSQQPAEREAVKRDLRYAIRGCQLEEAMAAVSNSVSQEALGLAEGLGDLYCKLSCAEQLGKPARELAVIHVSLAATYSDLRQHSKALEHYRHELKLREGNPKEECETWLNIASCQEESGVSLEEVDNTYTAALNCAERAAQRKLQVHHLLEKPFKQIVVAFDCRNNACLCSWLQKRVLKAWLQAQRRAGSAGADITESRLQELCEAEGCRLEDSDEEEDDEEMQNSEPLDSDIQISDSDDDLDGYDKLVTGRRKTGRWNRRNEKGETALHRACIDGNLKQVHYLVEQGHPLNPRDHCGWTPLHEACNHGHLEVVGLLLEKGANINDPGGAYCDGVTPLHDALSCGHFEVARLLVQRGASVNTRNNKGDKPLDTLRQWIKTYGHELDQETRQDCSETEKLLKKALAGAVAAVPVTPKPLQDSQLFDAECSEPLLQQSESRPISQHASLNVHTPPEACTPPRARRSTGPRHRPRGTEENVLFGNESSSSEHSDSEISPLRPVRPKLRFGNVSSSPQKLCATQDIPDSHGGRQTDLPSQPCSGKEEYHRVIQNLGSAKSRLLSQSLSEPAFSSTPAVSTNHQSALVPEELYIQDDWLEDDLGNAQPKKKRRLVSEQENRWDSGASRNQSRASGSSESSARGQSSSGRSLSLKKSNKARQVKMSQLPGMVMLGRREVTRSPSPIITPVDEPPQVGLPQPYSAQTVTLAVPQTPAAPMPAPIRMRVRVQNNIFLIPVPHSEAESCTVAWLCEQAAQRYYQTCGLLPRLSLQKEGALLSPADLLLAVLHTNEEVLAEVCSWDLPPLPERYKKACKSLGVEENRRVLRLCEVQDGTPHVCVCGLSLAPTSLSPLLRALKLQSSLTELRLSANRLNDELFPELLSAATTMPRLRLLDISANQITGEGIKKAAAKLEEGTQHAFPCLEELNLSMNPLGDGWSQALACLLAACPLLATLSLQACGLTARFLQQHRLLLANALTGTGHLRSVCLSQNALGATGFELVLKTLPLQHLTHLELNAVCKGPSDQPALDLLNKLLTQGECSLTHLGLGANGLTDQTIRSFTRCLALCPSLVSLDLSANPSVTSAGLHSILSALGESQRSLTHLNLQGCQVCGPWDMGCLDSLAERVKDLQLCSQRLNKLDQEILQRNWPGRILSHNSKCLLSISLVPH
ncbi:Tonsoku-like protein [Bagarius yarrelli]|uniref:Tonsoku-like protein n=1 Tax=Bagarius yarrelli TaxID=175774 RepID=A0A556U989_BAGYA|nr:Tonsoku-like protein [Bagarius yarrelli]